MNEKRLHELLETLFKLTYDWKSGSDRYNSPVINKEGKLTVENIIRQFVLENHDEKIGVLEAKVFMYEQIISKSNFAPMLETREASAEKNKVQAENDDELPE